MCTPVRFFLDSGCQLKALFIRFNSQQSKRISELVVARGLSDKNGLSREFYKGAARPTGRGGSVPAPKKGEA
jgi:hypothetical protein